MSLSTDQQKAHQDSQEQQQALATVSAYGHQQLIEASLRAQDKTWQVLEQLSQQLEPGQTESQVKQLALDLLAQSGSPVNWHSPFIRFGANTTLTYWQKAEQDQTLQAEDIVFFDLGAVYEGIEGDVGQTVVLGGNPLHLDLKQQSEHIFNAGVQFWRETQPTGKALYDYVNQQITDAGYVAHLDPAGHLIGSFPHKQVYTGGLNHYAHYPEPGIWILEIQMRHPTKALGAFYEAILI